MPRPSRRAEVCATAARLFREYGYSSATMDLIADEVGLNKGTLYHYPNPHNHQILSVAAAPAPHKIAEQIYNQGIQTQMAVRYFKGEPLEKTLAWASDEIEGFMRN